MSTILLQAVLETFIVLESQFTNFTQKFCASKFALIYDRDYFIISCLAMKLMFK